MADITLTASIRSNLLSLQLTNKLLDRTSERLSTGLKVNSALDNPGSFFAARSLSNRAGDLANLKDGIGQGIQTIKAADVAISSITSLVEQAKSIANQALEKAASLGGTSSTATYTYTGAATTTTNAAVTSTASTTDTLVAAFGATSTATVSVQFDGGTTVTVTAGVTISTFLSAIETAAGGAVTATYNTATDKIEVKHLGTADSGDASDTLIITDSDGTAVAVAGSQTTTFTGSATIAAGDVRSSNSAVTTLQTDFNKIITQINELVGDAGYKGVNLINNNNLTVKFNEDGSSKIEVSGVDLLTTGTLAISTAAWGSSDINATITAVDKAVTTLRNTSQTFSTDLSIIQNRDDFTTKFINELEEGASKLVNANLESESANLLALQTRQALGTTSLTFANQAQQSILQLFR